MTYNLFQPVLKYLTQNKACSNSGQLSTELESDTEKTLSLCTYTDSPTEALGGIQRCSTKTPPGEKASSSPRATLSIEEWVMKKKVIARNTQALAEYQKTPLGRGKKKNPASTMSV